MLDQYNDNDNAINSPDNVVPSDLDNDKNKQTRSTTLSSTVPDHFTNDNENDLFVKY